MCRQDGKRTIHTTRELPNKGQYKANGRRGQNAPGSLFETTNEGIRAPDSEYTEAVVISIGRRIRSVRSRVRGLYNTTAKPVDVADCVTAQIDTFASRHCSKVGGVPCERTMIQIGIRKARE